MRAVFYRESDANEPVLDVLNSLPDRKRAVIENQLGRLNMQESDERPPLLRWRSHADPVSRRRSTLKKSRA